MSISLNELEKQEAKNAANEIRKDMNEKLRKEFDLLCEEFTEKEMTIEEKCKLVQEQMSLARHIIKEERSLSGENVYIF